MRAGHRCVLGFSQPSTVTESVPNVRRRVIQRQEEAEHSALREKRTETQGRRDSHKYSRRPDRQDGSTTAGQCWHPTVFAE